MAQVVDILPDGRQGSVSSTYSIQLLWMTLYPFYLHGLTLISAWISNHISILKLQWLHC